MKNWRFIWLIEIINLNLDVLLHHNDKLGVFADFIITDFIIMINWLFPAKQVYISSIELRVLWKIYLFEFIFCILSWKDTLI